MHDFEILKIIVATVAKVAKLKSEKLLYDMGRHPSLAKLRDTTLYLIRQRTKLSFPEIGRVFGRSHAAILQSVKREEIRLERKLFLHPGGPLLSDWHKWILNQVDAAIAAETAKNLPN